MVRPTEYLAEDIIAAGKELTEQGRAITGFALRKRIGGGNPSRLKQVWDEYLASLSTQEAEPDADLPVEIAEELQAVSLNLVDTLNTLAVRMNSQAIRAAERRVAEIVKATGEQRSQMERELSDATETVDDLEDALEKANQVITELKQMNTGLQQERQAQAIEIAQGKERLHAAQQDLAKAMKKGTETEQTLGKTITSLNAQVQSLNTELIDTKARTASEISFKDARITELSNRLDTMGVENYAQIESLSNQKAEISQLVERNANLMEQLAKSQQAENNAVERMSEVQNRLSKLEGFKEGQNTHSNTKKDD